MEPKKVTTRPKASKVLWMKFLEFLTQNERARWFQFELLVEHENKKIRNARTGNLLKQLLQKKYVKKEHINKAPYYSITPLGRYIFEKRKAEPLLTASAPFYFEGKKTTFISVGEKLADDEQDKIKEIFKKHRNLRSIMCVERKKKTDSCAQRNPVK